MIKINTSQGQIDLDDYINDKFGKDSNDIALKGIAISLSDSVDEAYYDKYLPIISNIGASLEVVPFAYVSSYTDSMVTNDVNIDSKLALLIKKTNQYNVKIAMIKPHIVSFALGDDFARASYLPSDITTFFSRWQTIINYYTNFCTVNNIKLICLCCETSILFGSTYYSNWNTLINNLKSLYPKVETLFALKIYDLKQHNIDYINGVNSISSLVTYTGVTYYPSIGLRDGYKQISYRVSADGLYYYDYIDILNKATRYFNKPIIITEAGCTIKNDGADPINPISLTGSNNEDIQSYYMTILLDLLSNLDNIYGVYLWHVSTPFSLLNYKCIKPITAFIKGGI